MKYLFTPLILFISLLASGQSSQKHDYFVQFNGQQLAKKVNVIDILNHPLFQDSKAKSPDFDIKKLADFFKLDQKIYVSGNFSDSIPYYQITIPIKSRNDIRNFILADKGSDSNAVVSQDIQDFSKYSVLRPKQGTNDPSIAWNDEYLVILKLTQDYYQSNMYSVEEAPVMVEEAYPYEGDAETIENNTEEVYEVIVEGVIEEAPPMEAGDNIATEAEVEETVADTEYGDTDENAYAEYEKDLADFQSLQSERESEMIKLLFENGFTVPFSDKINETADVSSWINYDSAMTSMSSFYNAFRGPGFTYLNRNLLPATNKEDDRFIKGINLDLYFENDNVRLEEAIEYSKTMADIMGKIAKRKVNKRVFKYFPANEPVAYMSYHLNTKEALKNFPLLMSTVLERMPFEKDDVTVVTDLISTIVDEKATATLFDGDFSLFLNGFEEKEVTVRSYDYDENFEEIVAEKTIKKQVPAFSVIFTSTHATFGEKLIQLGIRKNVLVKEGNYYKIVGDDAEFGSLYIIHDKDVFIICNSLNYFGSDKGTFYKEIKKDLKKNAFLGSLNIPAFAKAYNGTTEGGDLVTQKSKYEDLFGNISARSSKKMTDNKLKFEVELNLQKSDKNAILQIFDFIDGMY